MLGRGVIVNEPDVEVFLGSNATKSIRCSPAPVIAVP